MGNASSLKFFFVGLFVFISAHFNVNAQILDPVSWNYETEFLEDNKVKLIFKAEIDAGWHIYGQDIEGEGPIPTSFDFEDKNHFERKGQIQTVSKGVKKMDPTFGKELKLFQREAVFEQVVTVKAGAKTIKGELEYMTCDNNRCLPPETIPFEFDVTGEQASDDESASVNWGDGERGQKASSEEKEAKPKQDSGSGNQMLNPVKWEYEVKKLSGNEIAVSLKANIKEGWHIYGPEPVKEGPVPTTFDFKEKEQPLIMLGDPEIRSEKTQKYDSVFQAELVYFKKKAEFRQKLKLYKPVKEIHGSVRYMVCDDTRCLPPETKEFTITLDESVRQSIEELESAASTAGKQDNRTLWGIFLAGFAGGFIALLTPCVFPMIPLTVSFFTKSGKTKSKSVFNAALYGVSIVVIYVLLGFLVTKLFGSSALNEMASNIWFNLAFFLIFIVFAISLFGAFEITLPASWANQADQVADRGGFIGIFFMAFTLAVVSFSCTGPIIGTLLVQAAVVGSNTGPLIGMAGFSLALALPFALFAAFPGWLNSLPQSGGWMNTVKVTLGFLELGLALKFLSNVDMAYSWGILPREVFLGIWLLIALALGLYLLGLYRFPHDSKQSKLSIPRAAFGLIALAFAGYVGSGIGGNTLHYLSGFPPPSFYSVWESKNCPQGFDCFHDYEKGMAYAKQVDKPVMLDFTGWSCVNCRKMEENVWIKPGIRKIIDEKYVLVSLYVDEKEKLPKNERYVSDFSGKKINTVGKKWSDFQASRFGANSQPYYVLLDHDGDPLIEPKGYTPDVKQYRQFLEKGLQAFRKEAPMVDQ